jgi:hypothetical protein
MVRTEKYLIPPKMPSLFNQKLKKTIMIKTFKSSFKIVVIRKFILTTTGLSLPKGYGDTYLPRLVLTPKKPTGWSWGVGMQVGIVISVKWLKCIIVPNPMIVQSSNMNRD